MVEGRLFGDASHAASVRDGARQMMSEPVQEYPRRGRASAAVSFFDERRSNIYKLYRATRDGTDSTVNAIRQTVFYDPGVGTPPGTLIRRQRSPDRLTSRKPGNG